MRLAQFERLVRHPLPAPAVVMGAIEQTTDVEADETSGGLVVNIGHVMPIAVGFLTVLN